MTFRLVRKKLQPFNDATLVICKTMDSKLFRVLIFNYSLMKKKILYKLSNGFKSVIRTVLHRKEPFVIGLLNLNGVVRTSMMVNVLVVKL